MADFKRPRPVILCVLDGWGFREDASDNAVTRANAPNFRKVWTSAPHALLEASGRICRSAKKARSAIPKSAI